MIGRNISFTPPREKGFQMIIGLLVMAIFVMFTVIGVTLSLGFVWWQVMILAIFAATASLVFFAAVVYGISSLQSASREPYKARQDRSAE